MGAPGSCVWRDSEHVSMVHLELADKILYVHIKPRCNRLSSSHWSHKALSLPAKLMRDIPHTRFWTDSVRFMSQLGKETDCRTGIFQERYNIHYKVPSHDSNLFAEIKTLVY